MMKNNMNKYDEWCDNYKGDIFRKCVKVSKKMKRFFPELEIVKGLVQIVENCEWYPHQWLKTNEGYIVDPTKYQWQGIIQYREIGEHDNKPIGKCPNCGDYIFENGYSREMCSRECEVEYIRYLQGGI